MRFAVVKSTSWSLRGPEFSSQDSHRGTDTHSHLIPAQGRANARASKGTFVYLPTHIYTNEKSKFIKKKKKKKNDCVVDIFTIIKILNGKYKYGEIINHS